MVVTCVNKLSGIPVTTDIIQFSLMSQKRETKHGARLDQQLF